MRRARPWLVGALLLAGASGAQAQADSARAWQIARVDAEALLQDWSGPPFLDSLEVERLARALVDIRAAIPTVRDIHESRYAPVVSLLLKQGVKPPGLRARPDDPERFEEVRRVRRIGLADIDSVNRVLHADSTDVTLFALEVHFSHRPNLLVLARHYGALREVEYASPEVLLGGATGDGIVHFRRNDGWYFVFVHGYGDCEAGCRNHDYHYVTYDPATASARLVASWVDGWPKPDRVALWDIPSGFNADVYRDYSDLRAQLADSTWWIRHHAVAVVETMLSTEPEAWRGPNQQDSVRFRGLQAEVLAHRDSVLLLLADRVADEDASVRGIARRTLARAAGRDLGERQEGRQRWRAWLSPPAIKR